MKNVIIIIVLAFFPPLLGAQEVKQTLEFKDARDYINTVEKVTKLPLDDQIDVWKSFLADHPKTSFQFEIDRNIEALESLQTQKTKAGATDTETQIYQKALLFSKKIPASDQIQLWEQFIQENPNSIYKSDAQTRLNLLKRKKKPIASPLKSNIQPNPLPPSAPETPLIKVGGIKPLKDEGRAIMFASLPGLVVPGMGHWYTQDYAIAGILTALRVTGIALTGLGIYNYNNNQIFLGGGISLLSYGIDIGDAASSAHRYNKKHSPNAYLHNRHQNQIAMVVPVLKF